MKLLTLSVLAATTLSFSSMSCIGQDIPQNEVPSVVLNAVGSAYPNATKIEWEKMKDAYEAEFEIDTKEYTMQLSPTGQVVQTKYEIPQTELPQAVANAISSKYKNQKIDDVELLEKDGKKYYQVELESTFKSKKLVLDEAGNEQSSIAYWD